MIGFLVGCILTLFGLWFTAAGHGSYAPLLAAAPLFIAMIYLGEVGFFFGMASGPLLWALYYLLIPSIRSRAARVIVIVVLLVVHLAAFLLALSLGEIQRRGENTLLLLFAGTMLLAFLFLVLLSFLLTRIAQARS